MLFSALIEIPKLLRKWVINHNVFTPERYVKITYSSRFEDSRELIIVIPSIILSGEK